MNKNELQKYNKLPAGWEITTLGEVLPIFYGKGLTKAKRDNDGPYAVYGSSGQVGNHSKAHTERPALIIGRKGSVGEVYYSRFPCWPIDTTYYVEEKENQNLPFFKYLLTGLMLSKLDKSTAIPGLSRDDYNNVQVAIAPFNEQKRIVAEIEKQFSRLDEAVDNLKRVKANLKRYKASVLKAAVEGKLTEEWRKNHPDVEPADKLLKRTLAERRKKWEKAELAKMKAKGKEPKDDKWKKKYKEPDVADQIDMERPYGWVIATIKQLTERVQYGSSSKTNKVLNGIPVLRMGNIFEGKLLLNKLKFLPKSHNEFPELLLEPGDLLFNRTNSPELVGKTAVYHGNPSPCSFASYLIRVRLIDGIDPNFINYYINSTYGRKWIKSVVSQQVGQANVNGTKLQALSVPLPPYLEQNEIVSEVENKISIIDGIEKEVDGNLIRAERLRQSILKKAFSGQLLEGNIKDISKLA